MLYYFCFIMKILAFKYNKGYLLGMLMLLVSIASAQNLKTKPKDFKKAYLKALESFDKKNYFESYQIFKKLNEENTDNANLKYWVANNLWYLQTDHENATDLLASAVANYTVQYKKDNFENTKAPLDAYLLLGRIYRFSGRVDEALTIFNDLRKVTKNIPGWQTKIGIEISICHNILEMSKIPGNETIDNLSALNTEADEEYPLVTADGAKMFVSRQASNIIEKSVLLTAEQKNTNWSETATEPLLWRPTGMTGDGRTMLYENNGDIYISYFDGEMGWETPIKLPSTINTPNWEGDATLSADGLFLIFVSDRPEGEGGLDMYASERNDDKTWQLPKNLGPLINSPYDEISPMLHADFNTLYFCSNGHRNMGGFDVYRSLRDEEGNWSDPINLGIPINSPADERGIWISPNNRFGYLSSNRADGKGKSDIYEVNFGDRSTDEERLVLMVGTVSMHDESYPDNVQITITNRMNGELVGVYVPNPITGKFLFILPPEIEYTALYEATGYISYFNHFSVVRDSAYRKIMHAVQLEPVRFFNPPSNVLNSQQTIINNIFFQPNSIDFFSSVIELEKLAHYLRKNPTAVIEIAAYSDAQADDAYNLQITQQRADSVKQYMMNLRVKDAQLVAKGYGNIKPVALNKTPDGRDSEEGRKWNRRIEFVVLQKGNQELKINPIVVPENLRIK